MVDRLSHWIIRLSTFLKENMEPKKQRFPNKHKDIKHNPHAYDKVGDWENRLEPPITLAEVLTKVTLTPAAPHGFLTELLNFPMITALVIPKKTVH